MIKSFLGIIISLLLTFQVNAQQIQTGAEQMNEYLPMLQGKNVGMIVNHTSTIGQTHLVDSLLTRGIRIRKIFAPEHGFRGDADAGETVKSGTDTRTGLPIISLYGSNKKPSKAQLEGIDILIFDIQDVGVRFYTYISTMHYAMEAAAEQNIPFMVLDRPNPLGDYVDGPVLEMQHSSFVGMHPIPVVHGLTVGELAKMINGEGWLAKSVKTDLTIIKAKNYTHQSKYELPIKPSPNLPNYQSVRLYPSLCFFEGTDISVGRGTMEPFQIIGFPDKKYGQFSFKPVSIEGMSKNPPHENKICYGLDLREVNPPAKLDLEYLISFYNKSGKGEAFFNNFFLNLAGTKVLKQQIIDGKSAEEIRNSWTPALKSYQNLRSKYLLYP
jgi:uncharacterized protein YbbC (DUF1343 family)